MNKQQGERPLDILKRGRIALRDGDDEARRQAIDDLRATDIAEEVVRVLLRPEEVGR